MLVAMTKCQQLFISLADEYDCRTIYCPVDLSKRAHGMLIFRALFLFYVGHVAVRFARERGHRIGKATANKSDADNDSILIRRHVSLFLTARLLIKSIGHLSNDISNKVCSCTVELHESRLQLEHLLSACTHRCFSRI